MTNYALTFPDCKHSEVNCLRCSVPYNKGLEPVFSDVSFPDLPYIPNKMHECMHSLNKAPCKILLGTELRFLCSTFSECHHILKEFLFCHSRKLHVSIAFDFLGKKKKDIKCP